MRVNSSMTVAAYDATAAAYDTFTAHHDYESWTTMIEGLARWHGLPDEGRLLDVGCGTGKSFLPWLDRGWDVVACDPSPSMLAHAAAKAPDVQLLERDARDLGALGTFDLVLALDDVVNLVPAEDHPAMLAGVASNLSPQGLFVFDLNTLKTLRTFFGATSVMATDDCVIAWRGLTSPSLEPGGAAEAVMETRVREEGRWREGNGLHREYHHPLDRITAALAAAGLTMLATYGQDFECNVDPVPDEMTHSKLIVIAGRLGGRTVHRCESP